MKKHELKCHPHFFEALARGDKNFEIRRNDRHFAVNDLLVIRKYDPGFGLVPGEEPLLFVVTYMMTDEDFPAIAAGFVIMGIKPVPSITVVTVDEFAGLGPDAAALADIIGEHFGWIADDE